jgi:hypothetical protein
MVFSFDGVVADLATVRREAWVLLAEQLGLPLPQGLLHHPELQAMPPEVAVVRLLRWARDRRAGVALAMRHAELAGHVLATHSTPQPGVREWLDTLGRFNVPCALVSSLDRSTVQVCVRVSPHAAAPAQKRSFFKCCSTCMLARDAPRCSAHAHAHARAPAPADRAFPPFCVCVAAGRARAHDAARPLPGAGDGRGRV